MPRIAASILASISELKRSPARIVEQAARDPVAILNHNRPVAYVVSPEAYERMLERLDDHEEVMRVLGRGGEAPVEMTIEALDDL